MEIIKYSVAGNNDAITSFIQRPAFDKKAEEAASKVLVDIRKNGDKAISKYVKRFDGVDLNADEFLVCKDEVASARVSVKSDYRDAVRKAHDRIVAFSKAGLRKDWQMSSSRGGLLGEQFAPLDRVGVYVPGGAAPLASTALMTVTLARVAGVQEIVVCTPSIGVPDEKDESKEDELGLFDDKDDDSKGGVELSPTDVDPVVLYALEVAGATEIYKVGGIQAIGMMAYGTKTVQKVQKIVGPGGTYVTAAKRQVYGDVALDQVAGPSEIAVLADETANPAYVAADLLSQAEHGTGWEKALLVTPSMKLAKEVESEVEKQAQSLSRRDAIAKVIKNGMMFVVVGTLDEGMQLCNEFAPEHLEIMVREPQSWLKKVRSAGAVFVGNWSPEAAGDFVAGPSHVLPTGGAAAMFSGLTVDDFRRRSSFIAFTRADLQDALPVIEAFGEMEGLDAHARSASIRFDKK